MELEQKIEVDKAPAVEADSTSADVVVERDYEAEARAHGWTPKEEFRGDASKWVDAETFAKRADEVMPFLKKQNAGLKRQLDDLEKQFKRATAFFSKAEERGYNRAMGELQAKHDEAVELGDKAGARKAVQEMRDLEAEVSAAAPGAAKGDAPDPEQQRKEFAAWVEANDWYVLDDTKRKYADMQADLLGLGTEYEGGTQGWLDEIGRRVERKFAERKPNPVNGGGNREGAKSGAKTFQNLPPEAQRLADKWVKSGIIKSRDDYVKNYDWG